MRISPIRNGRRIRPTFGHKRDGYTLLLCLICSRAWWRVWAMAATQDAALVIKALEMAIARRSPQAGLLHHSDRGSTYTSESYLALLQQNGMRVSMSCTANCYDNSVTESFFHSFKGESLNHESFQSRAQARSTTFDYIETFYNRTRRHSTLQYMSPILFEQVMG